MAALVTVEAIVNLNGSSHTMQRFARRFSLEALTRSRRARFKTETLVPRNVAQTFENKGLVTDTTSLAVGNRCSGFCLDSSLLLCNNTRISAAK